MEKVSRPLRLGGYQGARSVHTAGLAKFEQNLKAGPAGLAVERTDNVTDSGATARSLFDGIEAGDFHIGYMASGYLTNKVPQLGVLDLPFSVTDRHAAYRALDTSIGALLDQAVRDQSGFCVLGFWDNGFRHITNRLRPIVEPSDCRGMIVRTLDNAIYVDTMAAMGFEPLVTDVRDLKDAVTTGRVDAQENPLANTVLFDLHHHHPHLSLTGHFFGVVLLVANAKWFDGLPAETNIHIRQAAEDATAHQRRLAEAEDERAVAVLTEAGTQIVTPDRDAFRAACAHVIERESEALPAGLVDGYANPR